MICYVARHPHSLGLQPFLDSVGPPLASAIQVLSYEQILTRGGPIGHYVFTAHDRLPPEVLDMAGTFAKALTAAHPSARVLNHPLKVLERYALLRALYREGVNPFDVARLDEDRPLRYPVFLRSEAGTALPDDLELLHDDEAYAAALGKLLERHTRKGRLAVEFADARGADGLYRKYGAMRIGDRLIPQHMLASPHWVVKATNAVHNDDTDAEEFAFVKTFPHRDQVMLIFEMAHIEYGRMDYGLIGSRVAAFEINTNPSLPRVDLTGGRNSERRRIVLHAMMEAFAALNTPIPAPGLSLA